MFFGLVPLPDPLGSSASEIFYYFHEKLSKKACIPNIKCGIIDTDDSIKTEEAKP